MARVAILDDYQEAALRMADWDRLPTGSTVTPFGDHLAEEDAIAERLADFDVVVAMRERTPFPPSLLARLPNLRLLVMTGKRNASIDLEAARAHGITVCHTDSVGYPTAELAWALVLASVRRLPQEDRALRAGRWQSTLGTGLRGKVLGVVGLGRLGAEVAGFGKAFQMEVVAWSQNLTTERAREVGVSRVEKDELLRRADVVSVHLVLSGRTRGLIGARELELMKPTAHLVNTSRGPIVEEAALIEAFEAGRIAGAALDVFDDEPLPAGHPLTRLDNVVLTPHIGFVTEEVYRVFYSQAVEDIGAFLAGEPVRVLAAPDG